MQLSSISRTETKRLLDHAIGSAGMTAKKLADIIGVPESRISEGRRNEPGWSLKQEQAKKLIDTFGQPRGARGRFIRAEVAPSIDEFLNRWPGESRKRHLEKILKHVTGTKYRHKLASKLTVAGKTLPMPEILSSFEKFINSGEFQSWLIGAEKLLDNAQSFGPINTELCRCLSESTYYDFDRLADIDVQAERINIPTDRGLEVIASGFNIDIRNVPPMDLLLLGRLYKALSEEKNRADLNFGLDFTFQKHASYAATELKDFVFTGDLVWEKEGFFLDNKVGQPASEELYLPTHQVEPHKIFAPTLEIRDRLVSDDRVWDLESWASYAVALFIDRNCNYNLIIEVGPDRIVHASVVSVVIPTLSGLKLFEELQRLRNWLGLEELPEIEIKKQIASCGGYIPGATLL